MQSMVHWTTLLKVAIVLVPSYAAAYFTGEMGLGGSNVGRIWPSCRCGRFRLKSNGHPCG